MPKSVKSARGTNGTLSNVICVFNIAWRRSMSIENFIRNLEVAPAWRHHNLTVHPLTTRGSGGMTYLTLDSALVTGQFWVKEVSFSGTVPELKVLNDLPQPVLLLDGEELIGAKQNRVLNLTVMVPAHSELTIPVSCVEAGRWSHVSDAFKATDRAQFARGRAKKLVQVSYSLRVSGMRRSDQADVWSEINLKRARMGGESPTAAMSAIYESNRTRLDGFVQGMRQINGQVGAVFSINGKIAGVDIFHDADTFAKAAPKLMRSYAIDALDASREVTTSDPETTAVPAFLDDISRVSSTSFKAVGLGNDLRFNGPNMSGAALEISGEIIHLVSFPGSFSQDHQTAHSGLGRMERARRRLH
jgi:hypothetical protein